MDKAELTALVHQIEQFLLHQPTLLQRKFDVLAALDACRDAEQLHGPVFQDAGSHHTTVVSVATATAVIVNSTKAQLRHRYDAFQALARPHLALVGTANTYLLALYSAAQSLQRPETFAREREQETKSLAPTRSRRSFSSGGGDAVSHVQQSLALGNRVTEVAKKVELWRALSATIASTCVLSVLELANIVDAPLA